MRRHIVSLHAALILSGAAGLIYQSSWTRLLQRVFGVGDLAVATVLATFFLGLGIGNGIAARYVSRVTRPGRAYAILEVAIGAYALLSLAIVPGLGAAYGLLDSTTSFFTLTLVRFVLAALALLPPTILMGATLPVVAEASKDAAWSRSVTAFYTSNTLGAVLGAGLAGFVLVPQLGTRATVITGAVLSFAAAAFVLLVLRDASKSAAPTPSEPAASAAEEGTGAAGTTPVGLAATLSFLAGMAALGSEVVWTRILRIIVHGTTPAFAAMLVNYLLGIAAGALAARALTRRVHPAIVLGISQTLLVAFTALAMALVPFLPRIIPVLAHQQDTVPHETW
ncbi:MAG: MFS transporter, partial [Deltaproteobacteria bacterium]|nr:MFS transporter [Deltaproteobacteria bacterium]